MSDSLYRQPRALLLGAIYPPEIGGPATFAQRLAGQLIAEGWRVDVVTMANSDAIADCTLAPRVHPVVRNARSARMLWAAKARKLAKSADLVWVNGLYAEARLALLGASLPAHQRRITKVVSDWAWELADRRQLTTQDVFGFQQERGLLIRGLRSARTWSLKNAGEVIVPSRKLQELLESWGLESVRFVKNSVQEPARLASLPNRNPLRCVFVGRLTPVKGADVLLDAIEQAASKPLLSVIGDGPQLEELRQRAATSQAADRIEFLPAMAQEEVIQRLAAYDLFCLSSRNEGFPFALLEAMAVGMPSVVTDVGGVTELFTDQRHGFVVPAESPAEFAQAIDRLANNYSLRLEQGRRAREDSEPYLWRHVWRHIRSLLYGADGSPGLQPEYSA